MKYSWPGNVRELQNLIERAAAICETSLIQVQDLAPEVRWASTDECPRQTLTYLEEIERTGIIKMLETAGGQKINAAKLLGLSRTTLYKKMATYNLVIGGTGPEL